MATASPSTTRDSRTRGPGRVSSGLEFDPATGRQKVVYYKRGTDQEEDAIAAKAQSLAAENFGFKEAWVKKAAMFGMTPHQADLFEYYYERARKKNSPLTKASELGDWVQEKTVGRVADHFSEKRRQLVDKYSIGSARDTYVGKILRKSKIDRHSEGVIGDSIKFGLTAVGVVAKDLVRGASTALLGAERTVGLSKTILSAGKEFTKVPSRIFAGVQAGTTAVTGGLSKALPGAATGFLISGGNPIGAVVGGVAGTAAGAVTSSIRSLLDMNVYQLKSSPIYGAFRAFNQQHVLGKFWNNNTTNLQALTGTEKQLARVASGSTITRINGLIRGLDSAITGAGVGSLLGTLVLGSALGPAGALVGAGMGAGVGYAGQRLGDRLLNGTMAKFAQGDLLKYASKLPMQSIYGMIEGQKWIKQQVDALMGKGSPEVQNLYNLKTVPSMAMAALNGLSFGFSSYFGISQFVTKGGFSALSTFLGNRLAGFAGSMPGAKNLSALLQGIGGTTAGTGGSAVARGMATGGTVGGLVGGVAGTIVASLIPGLTLGLGAAIGATIGGFVGGAIGAAVAGGGTLGIGVGVGYGIGSSVGSFFGTILGGLADTFIGKIFNIGPVLNPLVLIEGFYNLYRFLTTPLRNLADYANVGLIAISLVTFFLALADLGGAASTTSSFQSSGDNTTANQSQLTFAGSELIYEASSETIKINSQEVENYSITGVEHIEKLADGKVGLKSKTYYWILTNPGNYIYDAASGSFAAAGKSVAANVYTLVPATTASTDPTTANPLEFKKVRVCEALALKC